MLTTEIKTAQQLKQPMKANWRAWMSLREFEERLKEQERIHTPENFPREEGYRKTEEYLGLFSAELQPLLDWVLWEEMEKLSSQVLISDQGLQSQPTAKLLYPDSQTLAG